jgi:hypothetical protein
VGKIQTGVFGGAVFGVAQSRKGRHQGLTTLALLEGAFPGAPSYSTCRARAGGRRAVAARLNPRVLQRLRAKERGGQFSTRGKYSAATVRGTTWVTTDQCDGTLTTVQRGSVSVLDFARHKTVVVHAGHSYLAKAPAAR